MCWGGLLVGLGLKLATRLRSHGIHGLLAAGQPDYAAGCAWNLGWAGWAELCLLLDGQGLFHTHLGLRLGGELLAGHAG